MPPHLVITFDYDAALYLKTSRKNANERAIDAGVLVFSTGGCEGDFAGNIEGHMPGAQTAFVSVLSTLLYAQLNKESDEEPFAKADVILSCALLAKRRLLQSGFVIPDREKDVPFAMQSTTMPKPERSVREMPRLYYSEGIFSLQTKTIDLKAEDPPDPYIEKDDVKARIFGDPFNTSLDSDLSDQGLAIFRFLPRQIPKKDRKHWSVFSHVARAGDRAEFLKDIASHVIFGRIRKDVPTATFGKIRTADVGEIEDFRTVRKLLQSYLGNNAASKPLGIAVFGAPGAGKSFAVNNIVENLPDAARALVKDDRHECNLTALSDPEDLAHFFQLARNSALRGKVPFLFFDEFDCTVAGSPFFWLKHFLAPLQDGSFRSNHIIHPIGRAVFVFAGGVYRKFDDFADDMKKNSEQAHASVGDPKKTAETPNFKGIDFLSRLHAHMDIAPFSPDADEADMFYPSAEDSRAILIDPAYLMRRAFTLRSMLEIHLGKIISKGSRRARIDRRIVNALLATKAFAHGARSMEAIVRMSHVDSDDGFEIAHLPTDKQLKMHVDTDNFNFCLENDVDALWRRATRA
jgi:hypothetical protein